MSENKRKQVDRKAPSKRDAKSATAFPPADDEAVQADPLKRRKPEPKKPGERLEDYLG
jgi:hypothetical protein